MDNMEKHGLIERRRNREDRRVINIFLTNKGRSMRDAISTEVLALNDLALQDFTEKERTQLHKLLSRLTNAIETIAESDS